MQYNLESAKYYFQRGIEVKMPEVAATGDPTRYREDIPTEEFDGSKYLVKQYFKTHVHSFLSLLVQLTFLAITFEEKNRINSYK